MVFVSRRFRRVEKRPALFITGKALTPYEIASCIDDGEDFQRWGADGNGHVEVDKRCGWSLHVEVVSNGEVIAAELCGGCHESRANSSW
ncbi:hypothetical protein AAC387_Pa01g3860 [Persea americana]